VFKSTTFFRILNIWNILIITFFILICLLCICFILFSLFSFFLFILLILFNLSLHIEKLSITICFINQLLSILISFFFFRRIELAVICISFTQFFLQHFSLVLSSLFIFSLLMLNQLFNFSILHSSNFILFLFFTSRYL